MRGYPKHLNSKKDFEYVKKNFGSEKTASELNALLASYREWFYVGHVESVEAGVTDDTHKVVDEGEDNGPVYSQYELRVNPQARIFRLGYTVEEVEEMLAEAEEAVALKAAQ